MLTKEAEVMILVTGLNFKQKVKIRQRGHFLTVKDLQRGYNLHKS